MRTHDFSLHKVAGSENVADLLTKHLDRRTHEKHMQALDLSIEAKDSATTEVINSPVAACCLSRFFDPDAGEHLLGQRGQHCEEARLAQSPLAPRRPDQESPSLQPAGRGQYRCAVGVAFNPRRHRFTSIITLFIEILSCLQMNISSFDDFFRHAVGGRGCHEAKRQLWPWRCAHPLMDQGPMLAA